jgi:hypothetical protein
MSVYLSIHCSISSNKAADEILSKLAAKRGEFPNAVACVASNLSTISSFSRPNFSSFTHRFAIPGDVLPRRAVVIETEKLLGPLARPAAGEEA